MKKNTQKRKRKPGPLIYVIAAVVAFSGLFFFVDFFPEQEKNLRSSIREVVEENFPRQAAEISKTFGLIFWGEESAGSLKVNSAANSVILVHGLDDPGKVWMNLAPELAAKNLNVFQLYYPNDQSIADSARFFADEIAGLKESGISTVAIVAHSMGGLVAREMLTSPGIAYIENSKNGKVPVVDSLIMVGTPNHGSELVRFRVFSEIRDQWVNLTEQHGHVLRGILDGAGEAKIDLLPDSQFLTTLNKRPYPENVKMFVIAGKVSPWGREEIDLLFKSARVERLLDGQHLLPDLRKFLLSMSDGLGDGLVTVDSTRLDGVDHRIVPGNHVSMIRNLSEDSNRIPPAIPLIIQRLEDSSNL